jgi:hypothetical protein
MTDARFDREVADKRARDAVDELSRIPTGRVGTDVMLAHSAKAAALAGIGIVHALLEVAAAIRETGSRPQNRP